MYKRWQAWAINVLHNRACFIGMEENNSLHQMSLIVCKKLKSTQPRWIDYFNMLVHSYEELIFGVWCQNSSFPTKCNSFCTVGGGEDINIHSDEITTLFFRVGGKSDVFMSSSSQITSPRSYSWLCHAFLILIGFFSCLQVMSHVSVVFKCCL